MGVFLSFAWLLLRRREQKRELNITQDTDLNLYQAVRVRFSRSENIVGHWKLSMLQDKNPSIAALRAELPELWVEKKKNTGAPDHAPHFHCIEMRMRRWPTKIFFGTIKTGISKQCGCRRGPEDSCLKMYAKNICATLCGQSKAESIEKIFTTICLESWLPRLFWAVTRHSDKFLVAALLRNHLPMIDSCFFFLFFCFHRFC